MDSLIEPFSYRFFVDALVVATIAGALCGMVGVYVVLRGMSYIGHGLSHAIFGWAVAGFIANIDFYVGAGIGGVVSAMTIGVISRRRIIGADAAIGVVTTAMFAAGIALISKYQSFTRNLEAALFGNVLGVEPRDVIAVVVVTLAVAVVIGLTYRRLLFVTFDPEVAEVTGRSTRTTEMIFSLTLAATVIVTMRVLGVTLIAAALVIPPAIARMLTDRFSRMLWLATSLGAIFGASGVYLSYHLDIPSGPSVVLTAALVFAIVFIMTRRRRPSSLDEAMSRSG